MCCALFLNTFLLVQCKGDCIKDLPGSTTDGPCWHHLVLRCLKCSSSSTRQDPLYTEGEACPHIGCFIWAMASCACNQLQICTFQPANLVYQHCLGMHSPLARSELLHFARQGLSELPFAPVALLVSPILGLHVHAKLTYICKVTCLLYTLHSVLNSCIAAVPAALFGLDVGLHSCEVKQPLTISQHCRSCGHTSSLKPPLPWYSNQWSRAKRSS